MPPIQIYKPEHYKADNQNWKISQSNDKYIYVANNRGLLEFNGSEWQLYPSPNNTIIRSVNVIGDTIYTGCYKEFGYWVKNSFGKLKYVSLTSQLSEKMKEEDQIWDILEHNEWIIFHSFNRLFFFNRITQLFNIINSEKDIFKVFKIRNDIYYHVQTEGIYKIENGKPKLVINDPLIKDEKVTNIFEVNNSFIFLTRESGFYKLENDKIVKWDIPANDLISQTTILCGIKLKVGGFIIGTISQGIINIKPDGLINYQISQRNGLSNNTALALFEDAENNLWIGLDNGINCINITSPVQVYYDYNGVLGTVYTSKVFKNYLYLGTNQGLFYKEIDSNNPYTFIEGTGGQVWDLFNYKDEDLLCGHHLGTYLIHDDKAHLIDNNSGTWNFKTIPNHDKLLLKGNYNGLYILDKSSGRWKVRNKIEGFNSSSRFFVRDNKNHVWVSHEYKGIFKLRLNDSLSKADQITMEPTLSIGRSSSLIKYKGTILYAYENGIFKYDDSSESFKYDSLLSPIINREEYISGKLVVDEKDRLWAFSKENIYYISNDHITNKPQISSIAIPVNLREVTLSFENISPIRDDVYLLGTASGYFTIDLAKINKDRVCTIHLNSITLSDLSGNQINYNKNEYGEFDYKYGILTLNYSVPNYNKYLDVKYQYRLDGHNDKWSNWTTVSEARFENLGFGKYIFEVRARVGNKLSENTISYSFKVQRPRLLSNTALIIYVMLLFFLAYIIHKANNRYFNKKLINKQLENEKLLIQIRNENLNKDVENKNRELAISKMSIIRKNELLNGIKKELKNIDHPQSINSVIKLIDKNLSNTKDWEFFVKAFNSTDKKFLDQLKTRHPDLTPNDLRFCVYLRLNLSSKEIAPLLNISVKSVETKRYRLRKRMKLPHEESLVTYILSL